jgi:hypothetical protein
VNNISRCVLSQTHGRLRYEYILSLVKFTESLGEKVQDSHTTMRKSGEFFGTERDRGVEYQVGF